jgi:hypothetical protein
MRHVGYLDREGGDGEHRQQHHGPEDDVVGVEPVRVRHESLPGAEDRQEQSGESAEPS